MLVRAMDSFYFVVFRYIWIFFLGDSIIVIYTFCRSTLGSFYSISPGFKGWSFILLLYNCSTVPDYIGYETLKWPNKSTVTVDKISVMRITDLYLARSIEKFNPFWVQAEIQVVELIWTAFSERWTLAPAIASAVRLA